MDYEGIINKYSVVSGKRIVIDPMKFVVVVDEKEIILYPKEFDVLYFLARHPDWVLSAEQIYYAVWYENLYGCEHVIYNTVCQIRKKLNMPDVIQTIKNRGYKFIG